MGINWDDCLVKKLTEAEKVHIQFLQTAERILEVLANHTQDGLKEKEISKRAKARKQRLVKTLRKLVEIKSLVRVGKGTKTDPYCYLYFQEQENKMETAQNLTGTSISNTAKTPVFSTSTTHLTVKK